MRHVLCGAGAVLLLATACSKGERANQANDSAAGASAATNAQPAALAQIQQQRPRPGQLTKPLAQYSGVELAALVDSLPYIRPVTRPRRCRDAPGCGGNIPTANTQVRAEAIRGQDSVGGGTVGPFGTIVSRAQNIGGQREERYGFRPGNRYQYILVILPDSAGTGRWQIEELDAAGANRSHAPLVAGHIRGCGHPFVAADPRVDFRTCEMGPLIRTASLQGSGDPPWWYSCYPQGCCEATQ